jgi:hypothetical protein
MTDKLDEGLPKSLSKLRMWRHDVHGGENWKPDSDANDLEGLQNHILSPEAG